jgi:hypothetical protein
MTGDDTSQGVPQLIPGPDVSPEDLAKLLVPVPSKGALYRKLIIAALIGAAGLGASIMSCVGQSFSLRQARAQEGIEQQLKEIRAGCLGQAPKIEGAR